MMNQLSGPSKRGEGLREHTISGNGSGGAVATAPAVDVTETRSPKVRTDIPIPAVADLERKIRQVPNLREIWSYINPFMLYGRHIGVKGDFEKKIGHRGPEA